MIDFTPADIGYLHWAFQDAINEAKARAEKGMSTSADAYQQQAANVKRLRDRILSTMPEHVRKSYPDYSPSDVAPSGSSASI